jgi:asparagine synthase (glutamine-hydrolysing)
MAWGLEARVPFLDKAFLEVAMTINPEEKMFGKGAQQEVDEDGCPKMEKVSLAALCRRALMFTRDSMLFVKHLILLRTARYATADWFRNCNC